MSKNVIKKHQVLRQLKISPEMLWNLAHPIISKILVSQGGSTKFTYQFTLLEAAVLTIVVMGFYRQGISSPQT